MVNKRGWLRIVEAIIAVLIVLTSVLIVLSNKKVHEEGDVCSSISGLLDEIAKNQVLREEILISQTGGVKNFLQTKIKNPSLDYKIKICKPEDLCGLTEGEDVLLDICAGERIISTTKGQTDFDPKKLKIFLFRVS